MRLARRKQHKATQSNTKQHKATQKRCTSFSTGAATPNRSTTFGSRSPCGKQPLRMHLHPSLITGAPSSSTKLAHIYTGAHKQRDTLFPSTFSCRSWTRSTARKKPVNDWMNAWPH
jgi:hypothetical protein